MKKVKKDLKIRIDNLTRNDPPVSFEELKDPYAEELHNTVNDAPAEFQELIRKNADRIAFAKTDAIGTARTNKKYGMFVNLERDRVNTRGKWTTTFHEIGHEIDRIYGYASVENKYFGTALKNDFDNFTKAYMAEYNESINEVYQDISLLLKEGSDVESHVLSDLFGGLSDGKCKGRFHHSMEYWNKSGTLEKEAFAHFFSATVTGEDVKLKTIEEVFPQAYEEFIRIVRDL